MYSRSIAFVAVCQFLIDSLMIIVIDMVSKTLDKVDVCHCPGGGGDIKLGGKHLNKEIKNKSQKYDIYVSKFFEQLLKSFLNPKLILIL